MVRCVMGSVLWLLPAAVLSLPFDDRHLRTGQPTIQLRTVSKNHRILTTLDKDLKCVCAGSKNCPCNPPPPVDDRKRMHLLHGDPNFAPYDYFGSNTVGPSTNGTNTLTTADFNGYYGYTSQGATLDTYDPSVFANMTQNDYGNTTVVDPSVVNATINGTIGGNSTLAVPPAIMTNSSTPVWGVSSSAVPITDQRLLTLYKGHDSSDRDGNSEYEDVLTDFHSGWLTWPSAVVPFQFDPNMSSCARSIFSSAMSVISDNSCVVFAQQQVVPSQASKMAQTLLLTDSSAGCFASLGYSVSAVSGSNIANLGPGCLNPGTAVHLLLHALGLFHEHQRPDRDNYVMVRSDFVDTTRTGGSTQSTKYNAVFGKADVTSLASVWANATMSRPYDYGSIMHNGPCHYSVNEQYGGGPNGCALNPSLVPAVANNTQQNFTGTASDIGNRATMSSGDVQLLGMLYNCPAGSLTVPDPTDAISPDIALCTTVDASNFAWTASAATAVQATISNTAVSSSATITTAASTSNSTPAPNETAAFQDYFRNSTNDMLMFLYCTAGLIVLIFAAVGFVGYRNKRKANRKGRRALVVAGAQHDDHIASLLRGDSTDSEAIAEILEESDSSPNVNRTPFTAAR